MKKQALNPYLPSFEYIADGEPHVFGDRLYIYGSHDCFGGKNFCEKDYVCWSAPVDDLSDWKYEGVIYRKTDDPKNKNGKMRMFAPDVCKGTDGRYYLYYGLSFFPAISVAVCDTPAGKYEFYGYVKHTDGTKYGCMIPIFILPYLALYFPQIIIPLQASYVNCFLPYHNGSGSTPIAENTCV